MDVNAMSRSSKESDNSDVHAATSAERHFESTKENVQGANHPLSVSPSANKKVVSSSSESPLPKRIGDEGLEDSDNTPRPNIFQIGHTDGVINETRQASAALPDQATLQDSSEGLAAFLEQSGNARARREAGSQQLHGTTNEALLVRQNMLRSSWDGFTSLTSCRKWILMLRMLIALAQVAAGIAVLSLPTSLGNSRSTPEECDPEGMFVFLVLHITRVVCSIPIDFYLGLSPHRSTRARRPGAQGLAERERSRRLGSLQLDRKLGRLGDLLGFCHVVLFIVGNYVVWTSLECSHKPADSIPLFFTSLAMLCITYIIIFEVALMVFLVIFFLPLLIAILHGMGLSHHLPQRQIHPETGKITQDEIEKHSKLVYYTPMESPVPNSTAPAEQQIIHSSLDDLRRFDDGLRIDENAPHEPPISTKVPLPPSRTTTRQSGNADTSSHAGAHMPTSKFWRFGRIFKNFRQASSSGLDGVRNSDVTPVHTDEAMYPLYPIPAHRATCPICLCDYEEMSKPLSTQQGSQPHPLRLFDCGHAMHQTCVDEWLTAVSGRCPVCQKPILEMGREF